METIAKASLLKFNGVECDQEAEIKVQFEPAYLTLVDACVPPYSGHLADDTTAGIPSYGDHIDERASFTMNIHGRIVNGEGDVARRPVFYSDSWQGASILPTQLNWNNFDEPCLSEVTFQILNMDILDGRPKNGTNIFVIDGDMYVRVGNATFRFKEWTLQVQSHPDIRDRIRELQQTRGYAITHACSLTRQDGDLFSPKTAAEMLDAAYWFFSFCNGRHVGMHDIVGYDESRSKSWAEYISKSASHYRYQPSWFKQPRWIEDASGWLEDLFPGFCTEFLEHRPYLETAILWHLTANEQVLVDAKVALRHRALISLDKGKLDDQAALRNAETELVELGYSLDAQPIVSGSTSKLPSLHEMRQSVMHPRRGAKRNVPSAALSDGAMFAAMYFDEIVLSRSGYAGKRVNRKTGRVDTAGNIGL